MGVQIPLVSQMLEEKQYTKKEVDDLVETICFRIRRGFFKDNESYLKTLERIKNEDYKNWLEKNKKT